MAEVYRWVEKVNEFSHKYGCLQVNNREFELIAYALMNYAEKSTTYEEIHVAVSLIKDMDENSKKVDRNPVVNIVADDMVTNDMVADDEESSEGYKKVCMGFQGPWCNECTQFFNCHLLAGEAKE